MKCQEVIKLFPLPRGWVLGVDVLHIILEDQVDDNQESTNIEDDDGNCENDTAAVSFDAVCGKELTACEA